MLKMRLVWDFVCGMMNSNSFTSDIARWVERVGTSQVYQEHVDCTLLRRFATVIGGDLSVKPGIGLDLGHWAMFKDDSLDCNISDDGHSTNPNGVIPRLSHPNRMLISSSIDFFRPIQLQRLAKLELKLRDIRQSDGKSGQKLLVVTERTVFQGGERVLCEVQTMAYLTSRPSGFAHPAQALILSPHDEVWTPTTVDLFRFSAVTFNAHRIHYDLPYARGVEGYPALVVQGPFTAAKLLAHARRSDDRHLKHFSYRANAPLFVDRPIRLSKAEVGSNLFAIRDDGVIAMTVIAEFA